MEYAIESKPLLANLVDSYIDAISSAETTSAFSILGLVRFYLKVLWWEINLFVVPFIVLHNLALFILNKTGRRKRVYLEGVCWRYIKNFLSLIKKGEIPFLKFITIRMITKLWIYYHIKSRVTDISRALSYADIRCRLNGEDPESLTTFKKQKTALLALQKTIPTGIQLRVIVSSIAPLVGFIGTLLGLGDTKDGKKGSIQAWIYSDSWHKVPYFMLTMMVIFAIGTIAISCFIQKREIFKAVGGYDKEKSLYTFLRTTRNKEFPVDIFGYIVLMIIYGCFWDLSLFFPDLKYNASYLVIESANVCILFIYIWTCRYKCGTA